MFRRLCCFALGLIFLTSCSNKQYEPQSKSFFAMDTYMTITASGENAEKALNQAEEKVSELEKMWSVNDKTAKYIP